MLVLVPLAIAVLFHLGACMTPEPADPSPPRGWPLSPNRTLAGEDGTARIRNGWFTQDDQVIWGYALYNGFWSTHRTSITRRAPGLVGPYRTEELESLTSAMVSYGYPGFEHCYGLWYDRRRDAHDVERRADAEAVPPFLEQPWARSGRGTAWDGLSLYDLEQYNPWYFDRLREFARLCDERGALLLFNFYMQHALLEFETHYVDFPWRPVNTIQDTGMPDSIPAARAFYDVTHSERRRLHRLYIRKCLDELGGYRNVVFLPSLEYTGPRAFLEFWMDTVHEWEQEKGRRVLIGVGATKDVLDSLLNDQERGPRIDVIDLRYWFYWPDGRLRAPRGGKDVAGRYSGGFQAAKAPPELIYRQVVAYRRQFPQRAILHTIYADRRQTWAFAMAGGSLLVRTLNYAPIQGPDGPIPPDEYVAPVETREVRGLYRFIMDHMATAWLELRPAPERVQSDQEGIFALADDSRNLVVYATRGGDFDIDLGNGGETWTSRWLDPRTGSMEEAKRFEAQGWIRVESPSRDDWALWLTR